MNLVFIFVLTFCVALVKGLGVCPAPFIDISPCTCIEDPTGDKPSAIQCFGGEGLDLNQVFEILDANIAPKNKSFNTFYLNNSLIEEIPENVFKSITFEEIIIEKTYKLSKINANSFNGLENSVKHLHLKDTKLNLNSVNDSDIQAFDGLKNVEYLDFSSSVCPPSNLLGTKCKCNLVSDFQIQDIVKPESVVIQCNQVSNSSELSAVFDGLNTQLTGNERNLFRFHLKESNIKQLPENLFKGITFTEVVIEDCPQLEEINKNVFKSIERFVNRLTIHNIDLKNETQTNADLWHAISSLTNLVSADLVNVFDEIPDKALKPVGEEVQKRFKRFIHSGYETPQLHGHRIKRIGRYAFYNLPNIQKINLQNNLIESIDKYSFANQKASDKRLYIRLARNNLNQHSLSVGSLAGSQRPIKLELGYLFIGCNRDMAYLNETVFSAFLDKPGNELDIGCAYVMQCDCNMKWLYDGPAFWRNKIKTGTFGETVIPCELDSEDGVEEVSIFDLPQDYFRCPPKPEDLLVDEQYESVANNTIEDGGQETNEEAVETTD